MPRTNGSSRWVAPWLWGTLATGLIFTIIESINDYRVVGAETLLLFSIGAFTAAATLSLPIALLDLLLLKRLRRSAAGERGALTLLLVSVGVCVLSAIVITATISAWWLAEFETSEIGLLRFMTTDIRPIMLMASGVAGGIVLGIMMARRQLRSE
jgi:hypothetical protein